MRPLIHSAVVGVTLCLFAGCGEDPYQNPGPPVAAPDVAEQPLPSGPVYYEGKTTAEWLAEARRPRRGLSDNNARRIQEKARVEKYNEAFKKIAPDPLAIGDLFAALKERITSDEAKIVLNRFTATECRAARPQLLEGLKNGYPEIKAFSIRLLGRLGPEAKALVPDFVGFLTDPNPLVRQPAAEALGQIGPAAKAAIPDRMEVVEDDRHPAVRRGAIQGLGGIGPDAKVAVPLIVSVVRLRNRWDAIKILAGVKGMGLDPADSEYLNLVLDWIVDYASSETGGADRAKICQTAVKALGRIGPAEDRLARLDAEATVLGALLDEESLTVAAETLPKLQANPNVAVPALVAVHALVEGLACHAALQKGDFSFVRLNLQTSHLSVDEHKRDTLALAIQRDERHSVLDRAIIAYQTAAVKPLQNIMKMADIPSVFGKIETGLPPNTIAHLLSPIRVSGSCAVVYAIYDSPVTRRRSQAYNVVISCGTRELQEYAAKALASLKSGT